MVDGKSPDGKTRQGEAGFTVTDRRSFAGRAAPAAPDEPPPPPAQGSSESSGSSELLHEAVDFHTFILSLGSSALLHLGELDQPGGEPGQPDLPLAKHTIDIIAMLEQKTKGNLSAPEAHLIESLLFDLRLRYVERSKSRS
jgi:hypothetical protein